MEMEISECELLCEQMQKTSDGINLHPRLRSQTSAILFNGESFMIVQVVSDELFWFPATDHLLDDTL